MSDSIHMHHCVERWQGGDRAAADVLLHAAAGRLEHLARRMQRSRLGRAGLRERPVTSAVA